MVSNGLKVFFAVNASSDDTGITVFEGAPAGTLLRNIEEFLTTDFKTLNRSDFTGMINSVHPGTGTAIRLFISKNIKDTSGLEYPKGDNNGGTICVTPRKEGSEILRKITLLP